MTMQKAPTHLWVVGIFALLWNSFGALDYTMSQFRVAGWIETMMPGVDPQIVFDWLEQAPLITHFFWAIGVWGGVVGAILLLMRNANAVPTLAISLVGAVGGLVMGMLGSADRPEELGGSGIDPIMVGVVLIAIALFAYARKQKANRVLQ